MNLHPIGLMLSRSVLVTALFLYSVTGLPRSLQAFEFRPLPWSSGDLRFVAQKPFGKCRLTYSAVRNDREVVWFSSLVLTTETTRITVAPKELSKMFGVLLSTVRAGQEDGGPDFGRCVAIEFRIYGLDSQLETDLSKYPLVRIYVDAANRVWKATGTSDGREKEDRVEAEVRSLRQRK